MSTIVEIDERGTIQLPEDVLAAVGPYTRLVVEVHGATLILRPEAGEPFWVTASPAERAAAVRRWAALDRPAAPILGDEALRREEMYD